ncbi:hypothetical protein Tco_0716063 [Tanacetum coccineum]
MGVRMWMRLRNEDDDADGSGGVVVMTLKRVLDSNRMNTIMVHIVQLSKGWIMKARDASSSFTYMQVYDVIIDTTSEFEKSEYLGSRSKMGRSVGLDIGSSVMLLNFDTYTRIQGRCQHLHLLLVDQIWTQQSTVEMHDADEEVRRLSSTTSSRKQSREKFSLELLFFATKEMMPQVFPNIAIVGVVFNRTEADDRD